MRSSLKMRETSVIHYIANHVYNKRKAHRDTEMLSIMLQFPTSLVYTYFSIIARVIVQYILCFSEIAVCCTELLH